LDIAGKAVKDIARITYLYKSKRMVDIIFINELKRIHSAPEEFVREGQHELIATGLLSKLTK
jgi:hypothetical protein